MRKLLLTTALVAAALTVATPAHAADEAQACAADDTPIVLEHGTLDGRDAVLCARDVVGESGLDALDAAGLTYDLTTGTAPMLCRIEGLPTPQQETCGTELTGDGYWAFLVAEEGGEWGYASTGLGEHVVEEGQFLALVFTPLSAGEDTTVTAQTPASAETRAAAVVPDAAEAEEAGDESAAEEGRAVSPGTVAGIVVVLLVLVLAAVVVVRRRRAARP